MELKQLEYFQTIVNTGSISAAARFLHMTQPPLSYQMKMLEEELHVSLFIRGTKKITLTSAGKTLYEQTNKILLLTDVTKREVIRSSQSKTLHIGMTPSTVSMMSKHLKSFSTLYPNIHFDIHEGSTFTMKEQLENHEIDITTLRTPVVLKNCETYCLSKEKLLVMVNKENKIFEGNTSIHLSKLVDQPLILSHRYRQYTLSAFEKKGLDCDIYCACEDARTAITLVEKDLGIAILPASMMNMSNQLIGYEINDTDFSTEILLAWSKNTIPEEVQLFLDMIIKNTHS